MNVLMAGVRRAWIPLALAAVCFALSVPAFRDLERLLVGLGVVSLLIALGVIGFAAAAQRASEQKQ